MKYTINIPVYSTNGFHFSWERGSVIDIQTKVGKIIWNASKNGLISLARHILNLAQDSVRNNYYFDFSPEWGNVLEKDSACVYVQKILENYNPRVDKVLKGGTLVPQTIDIPEYKKGQAFVFHGDEGCYIQAHIVKDGAADIRANKAGLVLLAKSLLHLAQDDVPLDYKLRFDPKTDLKNDSVEFIVEKNSRTSK